MFLQVTVGSLELSANKDIRQIIEMVEDYDKYLCLTRHLRVSRRRLEYDLLPNVAVTVAITVVVAVTVAVAVAIAVGKAGHASEYFIFVSRISEPDPHPLALRASPTTRPHSIGFVSWKMAWQDHSNSGRVLIFVETKKGCDALTSSLRQEGFLALAIHGDKQQVSC